jgi:ketosteroid isomerase-like protein
MNTDAVGKAVQEGNRRFGAAVKSKDYVGLAALYTADAKLLPPDAPIITGRMAIMDFWTKAAAALELQGITLKTLDLDASQDTAWEIGEALLELGTAHMTVKYVVIWRKGHDGSWRLHRDIWNSLPAQ